LAYGGSSRRSGRSLASKPRHLFDDDFTLDDDEELVAVTGSLARFVRNLVAGVPLNQEQALLVFFTPYSTEVWSHPELSKAEPFIRKIMYEFTSYRRSTSSECMAKTR
jgi:hypothetical protein